jgi:hypothetical protein
LDLAPGQTGTAQNIVKARQRLADLEQKTGIGHGR